MAAPIAGDEAVTWGTPTARWILLVTVLGSGIAFLNVSGGRESYSAGRCWIDRRKVTIELISIAVSTSAFCRRNTSPQTGIERSP